MSDVPPIRREVVVDLDPQQAFELFTSRVGDWWPLAALSVFGDGASVGFADGVLVERLGEKTAEWGEVTEWTPGEKLSMSWHPGRPSATASAVSVSFYPHADGTLVVLEHSGWEVFEDPRAARAEFDNGWPTVLERYRQAAGERRGSFTWVALLHRPGPQAPRDHSIFEDSRFADHLQFLSRMHAAGYLVAAGPMQDAAGEGMTILRLPGEARFEEAQRLATCEDESVKGGFLEVSVRPWQVMLEALS